MNNSVARDYPRDLPITGVFHLLDRGGGGEAKIHNRCD